MVFVLLSFFFFRCFLPTYLKYQYTVSVSSVFTILFAYWFRQLICTVIAVHLQIIRNYYDFHRANRVLDKGKPITLKKIYILKSSIFSIPIVNSHTKPQFPNQNHCSAAHILTPLGLSSSLRRHYRLSLPIRAHLSGLSLSFLLSHPVARSREIGARINNADSPRIIFPF